MRKRTIFGLTAAAMLAYAPAASAYWTGHAELIKSMIEQWVEEHTQNGDDGTRDALPNRFERKDTRVQTDHPSPSPRISPRR